MVLCIPAPEPSRLEDRMEFEKNRGAVHEFVIEKRVIKMMRRMGYDDG